jgi:hypothetical protein
MGVSAMRTRPVIPMSDAGRTEAAVVAVTDAAEPTLYASWTDGEEGERIRWETYQRIAAEALAAADDWDREHGIVRLDIRDSTLPSRLAAEIAERQAARYPNTLGAGEAYWLDAVNRTLAALAAVGARGEAQ